MVDLALLMLSALGFKLGVGMVGVQIATWGDHDKDTRGFAMGVILLFTVGCLLAVVELWPAARAMG